MTLKLADPRQRLITLFKQEYEKVMGKPHREKWGKCYGAMKLFQFDDEMTGEIIIDYPTEEEWLGELIGYWEDDWARDYAHYSITYFCKHFGKFAKVKRKRATPQALPQSEPCPECGAMKLRGQECSDCRMKLTTRAGG